MNKIIPVLFFISTAAVIILYLELVGSISILKSRAGSFALATGLLIPFTLHFLGYTELRRFKIYVVWLLLGVAMLAFYFYFKDAPSLQMKRGSALKSFKSLFVFLVAFQVSRLAFRKLTGREYITPSRGGGSDIIENKNPQFADFIMFAFLFCSIILGQEI